MTSDRIKKRLHKYGTTPMSYLICSPVTVIVSFNKNAQQRDAKRNAAIDPGDEDDLEDLRRD
jgi:hypothetical protein